MYHSTGFYKQEITDLAVLLHPLIKVKKTWRGRPAKLGLFKQIQATLWYLRRNRTQTEIAELMGVSQPTISRIITTITHLLAIALQDRIPTAEHTDTLGQLLIDGTLLPCWSWEEFPELWSGKHKTTGMSVQVACTLAGQLVWISDPEPGSVHDAKALRGTGFLDTPTHTKHIGDKGYIGLDMITPFRKPPGGELLDWQKEFNKTINKIRWKVEQCIAHIKNWRILHTDYRRPHKTHPGTITAVIGLIFCTLPL